MSKPLLVARRYRRAVPVLAGSPVRGGRFTATCHHEGGLLVGSTSVHAVGRRVSGHSGTRGGGDELGEIACGVEVPVEVQAAVFAGEGPDSQRQLGFHRAAARTRLAGWIPPIGDDQLSAVPGGLVAELASDLAEAGVGDMPGQPAVGEHAGHVEVFDHDRGVLAAQAGGELVQPIAAQVRDPGVQPAEVGFGALPARRRPLPGAPIRTATAGQGAGGRAQVAQCPPEMTWVGHGLAGGEHRQVRDAHVHAGRRLRPRRGTAGALHLDGERTKPTATLEAYRGRQDPGGAGPDAASELAGRLVRLDRTQAWQGDVLAVGLHPDGAGGEPHAGHTTATRAEPGKPDPPTGTLARARGGEVAQRAGQAVQGGGERLVAALGPPRRYLGLGVVPGPAQCGQVPPQRRGQLIVGDAVATFGGPLAEVGLHRRQCPVEREPSRPGLRGQTALLGRGRVQGEPIRLHHHLAHAGLPPVATATALAARREAERRPYRRAHRLVSTSVTSRTRSSVVSASASTPIPRPHAASDAARCSTPNRVSRSRCSTTNTVAAGSDRTLVSLRRCPFIPDPTSVTTWSTAKPRPVAPATTRPTCRSRSSFWSAEDTRQYATTRPASTGFGSGSTRINRPARRAGIGSLPSRYQRYAVTGCTPCASAHSLTFTNTYYRLLKKEQLPTPATATRWWRAACTRSPCSRNQNMR